MQRNRQRKRDASDIEVDRELEAQPELSQAQDNMKASGEARRDRHDKNTWHSKKSKRHTVMRGVGRGVRSGRGAARHTTRGLGGGLLLGSLLLGLAVRGWFTRARVLPDGQEVFEEIPAEDAAIPNVADRNMYLQLCRGVPPPGRQSRPSAAVEDVLAFYPGLHDRLKAVPRYEHGSGAAAAKAHHIKLDTQALFGLMRTAGMLPADITSNEKFRSGVDGLKDSEPAEPPGELPCMGKEEGAVNPLAHLDADWLGCDPGKTNMATVAHEERYPSGAVKSVWQRSLTAGQYYRQSGITEHAKVSKVWMAGIKPQKDELSQVTNYTASLQRYREYAATTMST
ncbi:hypothetical protein QJQ45_024827 [Haematococcus lacustris]|nr:hypothetical protein QJQ45_024827 [Haematococcus lacustris]